MIITPEVLDTTPNPKFLILRTDLQVDVPSFLKVLNPYKIAYYAAFGIPDIVEVFMTADEFARVRPIPEVFELVRGGAKIFERFLDNQYTGGQLAYLVDFNELPKLQLDPWKYLPQDFPCTKAFRNQHLRNLQLMAGWNQKRVKDMLDEHNKNKGCTKDDCAYHELV